MERGSTDISVTTRLRNLQINRWLRQHTRRHSKPNSSLSGRQEHIKSALFSYFHSDWGFSEDSAYNDKVFDKLFVL